MTKKNARAIARELILGWVETGVCSYEHTGSDADYNKILLEIESMMQTFKPRLTVTRGIKFK